MEKLCSHSEDGSESVEHVQSSSLDKDGDAGKAIMADGDLNKLLQLAHHCSNERKANENGGEEVLAASSLHLPLLEGKSYLQEDNNIKKSDIDSREFDATSPDSDGNNATEHALMSLKFHSSQTNGYPDTGVLDKESESAASSSQGKDKKKKPKMNRKPRNGTIKKKSRQKQSHDSSDLASALLRGVTMRPSGKWQAQLYYAGKSRYIGVFDTREKAATAYEIARDKLKSASSSKETAQSQEETEAAVAAARKAAFEGVNLTS